MYLMIRIMIRQKERFVQAPCTSIELVATLQFIFPHCCQNLFEFSARFGPISPFLLAACSVKPKKRASNESFRL